MKDYRLSAMGKAWYKGNLHCHTTDSDGAEPPQAMIQHYQTAGWDFLVVTDHEVFSDYSSRGSREFLVLPGIEVGRDVAVGCHHVVGVAPPAAAQSHGSVFEPPHQKTPDPGQGLVDSMAERGYLPMYCHPVWSRREFPDLETMQAFGLLEIYNHGCHWENATGMGLHIWDNYLRRGRRIWGTAVDDCHSSGGDSLGAWVVVRSSALSPEAILASLEAGHFYASSGPAIYEWAAEEGEIVVRCSPVRSVEFIAYEQRGLSVHADHPGGLTEARFRPQGREIFVRAQCVDYRGLTAWTNPIFLNDCKHA